MFASSMVLFVLAPARMFVLSRALASTAAREHSLRNSAASFVTAIDVDGVRVAALAAVRAVVERPDAVFALVEVDGEIDRRAGGRRAPLDSTSTSGPRYGSSVASPTWRPRLACCSARRP